MNPCVRKIKGQIECNAILLKGRDIEDGGESARIDAPAGVALMASGT